MKLTLSIHILLSIFLISNCGKNLIEDIKERFDDGKIKVVDYYKKVGNKNELVRKVEYYENGQISEEGNYEDGKKDGNWTSYFENGQISEEGNYEDGKKDGNWTEYYEIGLIKKEGNYKNGEYFFFNGWNKNGELLVNSGNGKWTDYWDDGKWYEGNFKDGKRDGKWNLYYKNRLIFLKENYKDGKRDGKWISYFNNGQIWEEKYYKNGELVE